MNSQLSSLISGAFWPRLSLWLATIVVVTMPIYPFLTTWLGSITGYPLLLKSAKDIALAVVAVGLTVWLLRSVHQRRLASRDAILWLLLSLVIVSLVVSAWAVGSVTEALLAGVLANGRYLVIFYLVYVSLRYSGAKFDLRSKVLPFLAWAGVGLAVVGILQVAVLPIDTLESFGYQKGETIAPYVLIDDNQDAPRAFATLRGPNDYAAYLLVTTLATIVLAASSRRWLLAVAIGLLALVLSSSRSAWLGLAVGGLVLVMIVYGSVSSRTKQYLRAGSYLAIVLGAITLMAATTVPALRLAVFHSSPDDTHLTEGSTDDHWIATAEGVERALDEPIGCGVGCAGPASFYDRSPQIAENYFVQIAEEIGVIGLLVWLGLFVTIMTRLWQRRHDTLALVVLVSGVGLSVVGVWLHVWYDDPVSLTWWALAALAIAGNKVSRKQPSRLN